jgi:catechol 2,3-dioxygenase-like lactoylglutathione lyase family enzyme
MIETHGMSHIALAVRDPERSLKFYQALFGIIAVYRSSDFIQAQTPGSRDVLVFERKPDEAGKAGGIAHFGFRLREPGAIAAAIETVKRAGGWITSTGEFVPGEPYLFLTDPDGHEVEIWYELPTPVDPA